MYCRVTVSDEPGEGRGPRGTAGVGAPAECESVCVKEEAGWVRVRALDARCSEALCKCVIEGDKRERGACVRECETKLGWRIGAAR